jgi:hypothetical protein
MNPESRERVSQYAFFALYYHVAREQNALMPKPERSGFNPQFVRSLYADVVMYKLSHDPFWVSAILEVEGMVFDERGNMVHPGLGEYRKRKQLLEKRTLKLLSTYKGNVND